MPRQATFLNLRRSHGLFADWAVLDKIEESQSEVKNIIKQIQAVLDKLALMLASAEKDQKAVQSMLDELIINTVQ